MKTKNRLQQVLNAIALPFRFLKNIALRATAHSTTLAGSLEKTDVVSKTTLDNPSIFERVKQPTNKLNWLMSLLWSKNGFRGEYLAKYIVSRFAFISESNVSEDFGIDFYCGLTKETANKDSVLYEKPFLLQIKTKTIKNGKNYKKPDIQLLEKHKFDTLYNLELPFFIGFLDLENKTLDIHTTSMMWHTYLITGIDNITRVTFRFRNNIKTDDIGYPIIEKANYIKGANRLGNLKNNIIDLGHPIITLKIDDLDNIDAETINNTKLILSKVIDKEFENIMNKRMNLHYYRWVYSYETNNPESLAFGYKFVNNADNNQLQYCPQIAIDSMHHYLVSLALSYKNNKDFINYDIICKITRQIDKNLWFKNIHKEFKEIYENHKYDKDYEPIQISGFTETI